MSYTTRRVETFFSGIVVYDYSLYFLVSTEPHWNVKKKVPEAGVLLHSCSLGCTENGSGIHNKKKVYNLENIVKILVFYCI